MIFITSFSEHLQKLMSNLNLFHGECNLNLSFSSIRFNGNFSPFSLFIFLLKRHFLLIEKSSIFDGVYSGLIYFMNLLWLKVWNIRDFETLFVGKTNLSWPKFWKKTSESKLDEYKKSMNLCWTWLSNHSQKVFPIKVNWF